MNPLCCPDCLWELFTVYEDGSVCCAECGCEIDVKGEPGKELAIN